jgi:hypothetical protein
MNVPRFAFAIALALLPASALASDAPVTYLVDAAALKNAVSGTPLTFEVHSNAACTSLLDSTLHMIDDVRLFGLKGVKPSGGTKPPKTTEIRTTLSISSPGHFYLKVTGTGVTPIGGACQAQAAIGEIPATCTDTIQNQGESDVDCGGANCNQCGLGDSCAAASDCVSETCSSAVCVASCTDGIQNQNETGIDCGGLCTQCGEGGGCTIDSDCMQLPVQLICQLGTCETHCGNGLTDGDETDTDCGGIECDNPCQDGDSCGHNSDCVSQSCVANVCQP